MTLCLEFLDSPRVTRVLDSQQHHACVWRHHAGDNWLPAGLVAVVLRREPLDQRHTRYAPAWNLLSRVWRVQ